MKGEIALVGYGEQEGGGGRQLDEERTKRAGIDGTRLKGTKSYKIKRQSGTYSESSGHRLAAREETFIFAENRYRPIRAGQEPALSRVCASVSPFLYFVRHSFLRSGGRGRETAREHRHLPFRGRARRAISSVARDRNQGLRSVDRSMPRVAGFVSWSSDKGEDSVISLQINGKFRSPRD